MRNVVLYAARGGDYGEAPVYTALLTVGAISFNTTATQQDFYDVNYLRGSIGVRMKMTPKLEAIHEQIKQFEWKKKRYEVQEMKDTDGDLILIGTRV